MAEDHVPPTRSEPIINSNSTPTIKFAEFLEKVGETSDSADALISSSTKSVNITSILFSLLDRIGSGDALTSDETGFTVDSINLTVDMDEA